MDADRCVMCGDIVPEGRMVCRACEWKVEQMEVKKTGDTSYAIRDDVIRELEKLGEMITIEEAVKTILEANKRWRDRDWNIDKKGETKNENKSKHKEIPNVAERKDRRRKARRGWCKKRRQI